MKLSKDTFIWTLIASLGVTSCSEEIINLSPIGTVLESNFYKTEPELFQGLVAAYDPLGWSGGWTMKMGLLNAASDDTHAGGSDASDQPSWVAYDKFTLNPNLGPQTGLWSKNYTGIYRANLIIDKAENTTIAGLTADKKARYIAEAKVLRAYYYFDLVRWFGNAPLVTVAPSSDAIYSQTQATPAALYAQIEKDLKDAVATSALPDVVVSDEKGRITKGAAKAMLGKVILFQNNNARMGEAATIFEDIITSNNYALETRFADIFKPDNKFGKESVFEIQCSGNRKGGWELGIDGNEGNKDVQFCGMRDFVGATYSAGWSFCPVSLDLVDFMRTDPRFSATIIDGKALKTAGANYTAAYQNTDYFIKKYAPLADFKATTGEPALNWGYNTKEIRFADVLLMAAECFDRSGNDPKAQTYLNRVRTRVALPAKTSTGATLLEDIYTERRLELATEGLRFWDLIRTNKAATVLGGQGFRTGKHELLPLPQSEIDIMRGNFKQNPGY